MSEEDKVEDTTVEEEQPKPRRKRSSKKAADVLAPRDYVGKPYERKSVKV